MNDFEVKNAIANNQPLPEGCTIGGYANLSGYAFARPEE